MMRVACILLKDKKDLRFLAETCLQFTPQVALGDHWIFLEIGACRKIFSESELYQSIRGVLSQFQISAKLEFSSDMPSAFCAALFGIHKKDYLPIAAIPYFFNPFQYEEQFEKMIQIFRKLGIDDLKKLTQIPPNLLTSKFNKDLNLVLRQINEAKHIYWPRFIPDEVVTESYEFQETQAISNLEPLTFVMKGLLDRVLSRLRGQGQMVSKIEIVLEQEKYSVVNEHLRRQTVELAFPHNSVSSLLDILQERLSRELSQTPLESDVRKVTLSVLEKAPGGYRQRDFFTNKEEESEALQGLISRIKDKLGEQRIFYAQPVESYFPEKSWNRTLEAISKTAVNTAPRPLRVLKSPIKLGRVDNYILTAQKKWRILDKSGPERLAGDWWMGELGRDYFRLKTEGGEELWVYSPDDSTDYYLHGIYD